MVALGFRLLEKMVDLNALFTLAAPIMHKMPDFQQQVGNATTGYAPPRVQYISSGCKSMHSPLPTCAAS